MHFFRITAKIYYRKVVNGDFSPCPMIVYFVEGFMKVFEFLFTLSVKIVVSLAGMSLIFGMITPALCFISLCIFLAIFGLYGLCNWAIKVWDFFKRLIARRKRKK